MVSSSGPRRERPNRRRTGEAKRQDRTGIDGSLGVLRQVRWHGNAFENRVTPIVEADQLREQFRAKPVAIAADPVDAQRLAHQATATLAGSAMVRQRRR